MLFSTLGSSGVVFGVVAVSTLVLSLVAVSVLAALPCPAFTVVVTVAVIVVEESVVPLKQKKSEHGESYHIYNKF